MRAALVETVGLKTSTPATSQRRPADRGFPDHAAAQAPAISRPSDDRATLFGLLADLVLGLLDSPLTPEQFRSSLRGLLMWCGSAVSGPHGDAYDDSLAGVAGAPRRARRPPAGRLSQPRRAVAPTWSSGSRRGRRSPPASSSSIAPSCCSATGASSSASPSQLGDRPGDRADRSVAGRRALRLSLGDAACSTHLIRGADEAPGEQLLGSVPRSSPRCSAKRSTGSSASRPIEDRFAVCLFFLKDDALGYRQEEAMVELLGVVKGDDAARPAHRREPDPQPAHRTSSAIATTSSC